MKRAKKLVSLLAVAVLAIGTTATVFGADEAPAGAVGKTPAVTTAKPADVSAPATVEKKVDVIVSENKASGVFSDKSYFIRGNIYVGKYPIVQGMTNVNKSIEDLVFKSFYYGLPPEQDYIVPDTLPLSYKIEQADNYAKLTVRVNLVFSVGGFKAIDNSKVYYIDIANLTEISAKTYDDYIAEKKDEAPADGGAPEDPATVDETEVIMVALRSSLTPLGYDFKWDGETKTVTIVLDEKDVTTVTVDKNEYTVAGEKVELSAAPVNENGSVYVPSEFFNKVLGLVVTEAADGSITLALPKADAKDVTPAEEPAA